jgi:hypothetical protein
LNIHPAVMTKITATMKGGAPKFMAALSKAGAG